MLAFRPGARRRRPHPYDLVLAGTGLLLGRGRGDSGRPVASLVTTETEDLSRVAPTTFAYGAEFPEARTQPWEDLSGGFGQLTQRAFRDTRYKYALRADLSVPGLWLKGPDISTFTPATTDATNGVSGFFDLGGATYAVVGRYVLVRANDASWTVSKDFNDYGAGTVALDATTFYSPALSEARAWVALSPSTENFAYFDGAVWTQATGASMDARAFKVVGRELYRARDTNLLTKCDTNADPTSAANWGAGNQFRIGDKASAITRLYENTAGVLVVAKTDGIYSLNAEGEDVAYFKGTLQFAPDDANGKGGFTFLNDLYLPFRQGLQQLSPAFSTREAGPEAVVEHTEAVRGRITAGVGHDTICAYAGISNGTDSYLVLLTPAGAWHGALSGAFSSKRITALHKSTVGAASGHARVYIGFSDGTLAWFTAPNDPNPAADADYTFTTSDGEVYLPTWTGERPADPKALFALTVTGPNLDASNYVQVAYRTDPDGGFTSQGTTFDSTGDRGAFENNTSGYLVDFKVLLKSTATSATPQVSGLALHHAWRPPRREVYLAHVLCEDGLTRWDNAPLRIGRTRIRAVVEGARDTLGSVTALLPDHSSQQVSVSRLEDTQAWDDRTRQWRSAIALRMVQFSENAVYGTHGRLEFYTHAQLEALGSHGRMETI